jgi:hypothetical protein
MMVLINPRINIPASVPIRLPRPPYRLMHPITVAAWRQLIPCPASGSPIYAP